MFGVQGLGVIWGLYWGYIGLRFRVPRLYNGTVGMGKGVV